MKKNLWKTQKYNMMLWVPVQFVNFLFVPPQVADERSASHVVSTPSHQCGESLLDVLSEHRGLLYFLLSVYSE